LHRRQTRAAHRADAIVRAKELDSVAKPGCGDSAVAIDISNQIPARRFEACVSDRANAPGALLHHTRSRTVRQGRGVICRVVVDHEDVEPLARPTRCANRSYTALDE